MAALMIVIMSVIVFLLDVDKSQREKLQAPEQSDSSSINKSSLQSTRKPRLL
jgi:hypothetical protein